MAPVLLVATPIAEQPALAHKAVQEVHSVATGQHQDDDEEEEDVSAFAAVCRLLVVKLGGLSLKGGWTLKGGGWSLKGLWSTKWLSSVKSMVLNYHIPTVKFFRPRPQSKARAARAFGSLASGLVLFQTHMLVHRHLPKDSKLSDFVAGTTGGLAYALVACPLEITTAHLGGHMSKVPLLRQVTNRLPRVMLRDGLGFGTFFLTFDTSRDLWRQALALPPHPPKGELVASAKEIGVALVSGAIAGGAYHSVVFPLARLQAFLHHHSQDPATRPPPRLPINETPRQFLRTFVHSAGPTVRVSALTFVAYEICVELLRQTGDS